MRPLKLILLMASGHSHEDLHVWLLRLSMTEWGWSGCWFVNVNVTVTQSCLTLCDSMCALFVRLTIQSMKFSKPEYRSR